ncbi:Spherulin-2A [Eumeta japonica]|uniref:Spherulin-2A n=1 Tax=Eumeta variegata TaxID=151549 RepID=A0A4C1Y0G0_EUMVA|nr:Spherulin-2A [Eumeta japonica]
MGTISPREEEMFQFTQENLKYATEESIGKRPDQVFVREPTPWNLYSRFDWPEVQRILRPIGARVTTILIDLVELKRDILYNPGTPSAWYVNYDVMRLKNNISVSWDSRDMTNTLHDISYNVTVDSNFPSRIQCWSSWGVDMERSEALPVFLNFSDSVILMRGEKVVAKLVLTKVRVEFEVEFETVLQGRVGVNYSGRHRGHHFWALDVAEVQEKADLPKKIHSKEVIKIDFFKNGHVEFERQPKSQ